MRWRQFSKLFKNFLLYQWKEGLISKTQPAPVIVPEAADEDGNNPATGLPYTDEERETALEDEVLTKINVARISAGLAPFSRSTTLDRQMTNRLKDWGGDPLAPLPEFSARDGYLELLLRQQSIQQEGKDLHDRLLSGAQGVVAKSIIEAATAGQTSSTDVIGALRRDTTTWNKLMSADATEAGVRYQRNPNSAATHHWGVSALTSADVPTGNTAFFADPAGQALVAAIEGALGPVAASALHSGADGGSGGGGSGGGDWAEPWAANRYYGVGAIVQGERANNGGSCLAKMIGMFGRSGDDEPLWPPPGQIIGDFEVNWMVLSDIPQAVAKTIFSYYTTL